MTIVIPDPTTDVEAIVYARVKLEVTGTHDPVEFPDCTYLLEYSDDEGATWGTVRGCEALPATETGGVLDTVTAYDYEAPLNAERIYRATTQADIGGTIVSSSPSLNVGATIESVTWWFKLPEDSSLNVPVALWREKQTRPRPKPTASYAPLGKTLKTTVSDRPLGAEFTLDFHTDTAGAFDALGALFEDGRVVLVQSREPGRQWYADITDFTETMVDTTDYYERPLKHVEVTFVETDRP